MATEREEALNQLTGNESAEDEVIEQSTETEQAAETTDAEVVAPTAGEGAAALLDSISEPDPNAVVEKPDPALAEEQAAAKPTDAEAAKPKTLEEEEAEALEGVKSERGRERIQATFAKLKETESVKQQLEQDITEFKEMVQSTKMQPQEFAQMLEFGRLLNSGDEAQARIALQMLDEQREAICKHLGIEAPGVDPLSDFPDLKLAVDNMEMTKEHALKLAKFERQERATKQVQQAQQLQQQDMQQFERSIGEAAKTADAYFTTRKHEADYEPKMKRIQEYFKDPAKIQEFVQTYEPKQWFAQFRFMYDNMSVAPAPANNIPQPIRARNAMSGAPVTNTNASPEERIMGHLESLGL